MKTKAGIVFTVFIVAVMLISLLPALAFAASDNSVDRVLWVFGGTVFDLNNAPVLRIAEGNIGEFSEGEAGEEFRLTLSNAEWNIADTDAYLNHIRTLAGAGGYIKSIDIISPITMIATVRGVEDRTVKAAFYFPLAVEVISDDEASVIVDARDSAVSSGTYIFANGGESGTKASLSITKADFDKNDARDITVSLNWGSYILNKIVNAGYTLKKGADFTAASNVFTIKAAYLSTLDEGEQTIVFDMNGGTDPKLSIMIKAAATAEKEQEDEEEKTASAPATPQPITPVMPVNPFTDVLGTDWFIDDVIYVYANNLMSGIGMDPMLFGPKDMLTRGMVASILYRMDANAELRMQNAELNDNAVDTPNSTFLTPNFSDVVADAWYAEAVRWAAANGIVSGYGDGRFGPADKVSREQIAVIFANYMTFADINPPVTREYRYFADEDQIADYAKGSMQTLNKLSIICGVGENKMNPRGDTTRAEFAAMLHRFMNLVK